MFKTKLNLYKIFLIFVCLFLAFNNSLLSNDNENTFTDSEKEKIIRNAKEAFTNTTPPLTPEKIDRIRNADFYKQKDICDFLNKVIIEIPIEIPSSIVANLFTNNIPQQTLDENPIRISLRLCNGDLVKIPLHAVDLYADYLLKNALKEFYEENTFNKIKNDTENFIKMFKELDPISDGTIEKDKEKSFLSYINKEHSLSYKNVIKDLFIKKVFLYIVFAELSLWIKEYFLGPRDIRNFEQLKNKFFADNTKIPLKMREQENGRQELVFVPEISFTLYELLKIPYSSYLSHPLTTGTNYFINLLDESFIKELKLYKDKDDNTQKRILFKILDSSSFGLFKKFLMLAKTIKILDSSVYKKRWTSHLKNNWDKFVDLLDKYKEATNTVKSKQNMKNIKSIEQEIKNFISKGHDISFGLWLKQKNSAFASSEMKINLIFNIPSIFLVGNLIHKKYKDKTLVEAFEKFKDFKNQPIFQGAEGTTLLVSASLISLIIGYFTFTNLGSPNY